MIIKIGRARENDVVIDNRTVSRSHATLEIEDGQIVLKDLGSASGTYVVAAGGQMERTNYMVVRENDMIVLGNEQLLVKELIEQVSKVNRETTYERNPLTGEIVKK